MKVNLEYQGYENMIVCPSISTSATRVFNPNSSIKAHMISKLCSVVCRRASSSRCFCLLPGSLKTKYAQLTVFKNINQTSHGSCVTSCFSKQKGKLWSLAVKDSERTGGIKRTHLKISLANHSMSIRILVPKQRMPPNTSFDVGPVSWPRGSSSASLICGLLICYSSSEPVHTEAARDDDEDDGCDSSYAKLWHGKRVYTDYSITGIPGDGRCMFRSVAHGACLRCGEPAPSESRQRELADDLRARVADEFITRREETEWFVEGNFDAYVSQIRKPHVWGGEPELFMSSHVLQMPITVYMHDRDAGGLISIAEYGQEYGKKNPIRVLYHGFGHYDALQIPANGKACKSRL